MFLEQIVLGAIQGVAEWLPVSSEGMIVLANVWLFGGGETLSDLVRTALFLHLGTFFAALIYLRREVAEILKTIFNWKKAGGSDKKLVVFLTIATVVSGILGLGFLYIIDNLNWNVEAAGKSITFLVSLALFVTAYLQLKIPEGTKLKNKEDIRHRDSLLLGVAQGFSVIPGLSRSGLTVAVLLLRKFDKETALKLSFLLSLPIVLGGNIVLNSDISSISSAEIIGLISSFVFGLLTIHLLIKMARKINFGYFVLFFAFLTLLAVVI